MRVFITGTAGFIGFHLALALLREGVVVHGYDGMTDYYDVSLKVERHRMLREFDNFIAVEALLEDEATFHSAVDVCAPDVIVHLAAQAGVRYSLENPRAYIDANVIGSFNVLEAARRHRVRHLLIASTSSVYGANTKMPYVETDKADSQMSFYAATKKASEAMGHVYSHLHAIPTTMFRFFTVYGPWGRPDMALFKFTDAVLAGRAIDVFNFGDMYRDFTYIDDLVRSICGLIAEAPPHTDQRGELSCGGTYKPIPEDSLSPVAPWRVVNIGNSDRVRLEDLITAIEHATNCTATRNYMEIQPGDVPATWADASLLEALTGYKPNTSIRNGVQQFVNWFRLYYRV